MKIIQDRKLKYSIPYRNDGKLRTTTYPLVKYFLTPGASIYIAADAYVDQNPYFNTNADIRYAKEYGDLIYTEAAIFMDGQCPWPYYFKLIKNTQTTWFVNTLSKNGANNVICFSRSIPASDIAGFRLSSEHGHI